MRRPSHKRFSVFVALGVIALAALIGFFLNTSSGTARQPPPGLTAGVSALDDLPPEANIPADVVRSLNALPPDVVGLVAETQKKIRKLRSNLGASGTNIYAFRSRTKSACLIVPQYATICPHELEAGGPGLLWAIGGGTERIPGALVGLAADNVTGVDLTVDQVAIPVTLLNNAVFADLPRDAVQATVVIHYVDADDQTATINLRG
jgi:hypothetical protein